MARLTDSSGRFLDLEIVRYQFDPVGNRAVDNDYDANWLMIQMTADDGSRRWSATEPAFLTWELHDLIRWLRAWADRVPYIDSGFQGIQPNLRLEAYETDQAILVRAFFRLEFHPGPSSRRGQADSAAVLDLPSTSTDLHEFVNNLEEVLESFPVRVRESHGSAMDSVRWWTIAPEFVQLPPATVAVSGSWTGTAWLDRRPVLDEIREGSFSLRVYKSREQPHGWWGEGVIVAADGSQAGLSWHVFPNSDTSRLRAVCPMDRARWGWWSVGFAPPAGDREGIRRNLAGIAPELEKRWRAWRDRFSA